MTEEKIGPASLKKASAGGKAKSKGAATQKSAGKSGGKSKKVALQYTSYTDKSGKRDLAGTAKKYASYAKSYNSGEMYQGASGTWYRNGRKVYANESGPEVLAHPEAVQRAYNERVSRDAASRMGRRKVQGKSQAKGHHRRGQLPKTIDI